MEFVCAKENCALNKQGHTRADLKHTTRPKIYYFLFSSRICVFVLWLLSRSLWLSVTAKGEEEEGKKKRFHAEHEGTSKFAQRLFKHATVWWLCSCQAREVSIPLPFGTNRMMSWNRRWDAFQVCLLVTIHHGNIREITGAHGLHVAVDFAKPYLPTRVCEGAIRALAGIEKLTVLTRTAWRWSTTSQSRVQITGWKYTATPRTML